MGFHAMLGEPGVDPASMVSFFFAFLGRVPLPPSPNKFQEGSLTFLGEVDRFVHVLAGFLIKTGVRGAFYVSKTSLLARAPETPMHP
jgi:hypothetical protein